MRIKINDTWYDPNKDVIMVELTPEDKSNITNMAPEATKYCAYPAGTDYHAIEEWMKT